jgi:hypothetical protein
MEKKMKISELRTYIDKNYSKEFENILKEIEVSEYRAVEDIVDKVNDPKFSRYCITILIDHLIDLENDNVENE